MTQYIYQHQFLSVDGLVDNHIHLIYTLRQEATGPRDILVHHAIALGLYTASLILVKGDLVACGSRLLLKKKNFGYSFPCDGLGWYHPSQDSTSSVQDTARSVPSSLCFSVLQSFLAFFRNSICIGLPTFVLGMDRYHIGPSPDQNSSRNCEPWFQCVFH